MADFSNPNSEVYFMTVPFSPDYKNVIDFANKSEQESAFKNIATRHFTNLNIIREDRPLTLQGDFGDYYQYNYLMYRNPLLSNKWWYAFIIDSRYTTKGDTEITFVIDVWQTFQFDTTYYRSMIERGIVPRTEAKSESTGITIDGFKKWTQSEPITVAPEYGEVKYTDTFSWKPYFCAECVSIIDQTVGSSYIYGGTGSADNYSSIYMLALGTTIDIGKYKDLLNGYLGDWGVFTDHRSDLMNIRVIPEWMANSPNFNIHPHTNYETAYLDNNNTCYQYSNNIDLTSEILAVGYKPRNKKMLGSLCRVYMLYNLNGFSKLYIPELFHQNTTRFEVSGKPISLSNIRINMTNYSITNDSYTDIPYDLIFTIAYDVNVGTYKAINLLTSGTKLAIDVASAGVGVSTAPTKPIPPSQPLTKLGEPYKRMPKKVENQYNKQMNEYYDVLADYNLAKQDYLQNAVDTGIGIIDDSISLAQNLISVTGGKSTSTDLFHFNDENMSLRFAEYNPSITDCRVIDDFLDMYGYTINENGYPDIWFRTRSNWNYIKTQNVNLKVKGNAIYEQTMKNILNSGVTIWHGFNVFGTYNTNRDDGVTINE